MLRSALSTVSESTAADLPAVGRSHPSAGLLRGVVLGITLGATLTLSACGSDDPAPAAAPSTTPAAVTASGPVAAGQVESCLDASGLTLNEVKRMADAPRFGADLEVQLDVDPSYNNLGVFTYPDAASASAGRTAIEQGGGSGVEVINNSVWTSSADLSGPQSQAGLAKVRSCLVTGA